MRVGLIASLFLIAANAFPTALDEISTGTVARARTLASSSGKEDNLFVRARNIHSTKGSKSSKGSKGTKGSKSSESVTPDTATASSEEESASTESITGKKSNRLG